MIEVKNLSLVKEDKKILDNVSFKTDKKIFAVIGANGAGKTSLSYCLMGVEKCGGSIIVNGKEINNLKIYERARLGVTLAWQIPASFEGLSVKEYLDASCRCVGLQYDEREKRINEVLRLTGLNEEYLDRKLNKLSGGERKRVELASVSLTEPKVVILDEPDSGIDMISFDKILNFIKYLSNKSQIILVTHSEKVSQMADEAMLLVKGKVIKQGPTKEILRLYDEVSR